MFNYDNEEMRERVWELREAFEKVPDVKVMEITKNNGVKYTGVRLCQASTDTCRISPILYLDSVVAKIPPFLPLEAVVDHILNDLRSALGEANMSSGGTDIEAQVDELLGFGYDRIRPRIFGKLINASLNRDLLMDHPHVLFHDLAVVFMIRFSADEERGVARVMVTNEMMERWGVTPDELLMDARANFTVSAAPVDALLREMGVAITVPDDIAVPDDITHPLCLCVSNKEKVLGAFAMMDTRYLAFLAEQTEQDLYILPSSIHEVLVIPASVNAPEFFAEMVYNVNRTAIRPEEYLSDNIYMYERETGEIVVAVAQTEPFDIAA